MTPMNTISAAIISAAMTAGSAADAAIRCHDAPGHAQHGVYWSSREIEGKRCWFISVSRYRKVPFLPPSFLFRRP